MICPLALVDSIAPPINAASPVARFCTAELNDIRRPRNCGVLADETSAVDGMKRPLTKMKNSADTASCNGKLTPSVCVINTIGTIDSNTSQKYTVAREYRSDRLPNSGRVTSVMPPPTK